MHELYYRLIVVFIGKKLRGLVGAVAHVERFRCRVGFHRGLHDCGQIQETRGITAWMAKREFIAIFFS